MTTDAHEGSASSLASRARDLLRGNDVGAFVKPARAQYPHQWNWDAALVALGMSTYDVERAQREVRSLLAGAWANGMVPHILYHHGASDYRPDPGLWRTGAHHPGGLPTSGLSQPPVLATCLRKIYEALPETEKASFLPFLEEVVPRVQAWHRWWHERRDPTGSGLVNIVHPWESGSDDAPRFAAILATVEPANPMPFVRADRVHVAADERPSDEDYARFIGLIQQYAQLQWDDAAIQQATPFLVQDPFVNAVLHRADRDLAHLASLVGLDVGESNLWQRATADAFQQLWNVETASFEARDARTGALQRHAGFASSSALWGRLATPEQARLMAGRLAEARRQAPDVAQLPTTSLDDPLFAPRRYWRGPVWIVVNWLVADGFAAYGYHEHAAVLRRDALRLVSTHGFHEHYDPLTGDPGGAADFSWSAALTLDLLRDGSWPESN